MNKNIIVLDESGNEIGATYFKRARGLVKKGRARFVSETAIRLACPPNQNDKEDKMLDTIEKVVDVISDATDRIGSGAGFKAAERAAADKPEETETTDRPEEAAANDQTDKAAEETQKCEGTISQTSDSPVNPVSEKARLVEKLIDMYKEVAISNGFTSDDMTDTMNAILDGIRNL